jgi:hypothetical protein
MAVLTRRAFQRAIERNYLMAIQFEPGDTGEAAYLKAMAQVSVGLS